MKNLITITSILAAGTLCANAAVNFGDDLVSSSGEATARSGAFTSSSSTIFTKNVGDTPTSLGLVNASNAFDLTDNTLYVCTGNGGTGWSGTATSTYSKYTASTATTDSLLKLGTQSGPNGTVTYVQTALSSDAFDVLEKESSNIKLTYSLSGISTDIPSLSVIVLYGEFIVNANSTKTASWTVVGKEYATSATGTHTITLSDDVEYSEDGKFVVIMGTGSVPTGTAGATNQTAYSGSAISITGLTFIPEPSMFGLLAGTLALGLAGTRRRRAK